MAFLELKVEVKLSHSLKDTASPFRVGLRVGGGGEKVIHVDDQPSFSDRVSE